MKSELSGWMHARAPLAFVAPALLALALAGLDPAAAGEPAGTGQARLPAHLSGLLNDYTPATASASPYEMHGRWSLQLSERGSATFSVEMTMETADFANTAPNHDPTSLGAHTHHISVTDGVIHNDPTEAVNWKASCLPLKPAATGGFVVTGTAYVTGNGGNAPFGNPSPVTICIVGGTPNAAITTPQAVVEYSNLMLTFAMGSPASTHFGTQPINGVVARCEAPWNQASGDCRVAVVE